MDAPEVNLNCALSILATQGWFSERSAKTRALLGTIAKLRSFTTGENIYLSGDVPNGLFGLVSGSLDISFPRADGEDYAVHRAGAGFWFGDLALFSQGLRLVSVHAAEPAILVQLSSQSLERLVAKEPQLYADFYALTYENFRTAFRIITNLAITSTDKRVADRLLLELEMRGDSYGWISSSQSYLARLMAISLPTLQRVLRRFAKAGFLNNGYARVQVVDREALHQICRNAA